MYSNAIMEETPSELLDKEEENMEETSWMQSLSMFSALLSKVIISLYKLRDNIQLMTE